MFLRISLQFFTAGADVVVIKAVSHVTISLKFVAPGGILDESVNMRCLPDFVAIEGAKNLFDITE
jgi:hypothetical protein